MCRHVAQRHNTLCCSEPPSHHRAFYTFWQSLSAPAEAGTVRATQLPKNHVWSHLWLPADQQQHKHCLQDLSAINSLQP